jgi:glycosyltransferase involved in cell wall biosynthesis
MRIGIFIKNLLVGGAQKQSILLSKAICDKHDITYIIINSSGKNTKYINQLDELNIGYYFLDGNKILSWKKLKNIVHKHNIELMIAYLVTENMLSALLKKKRLIKYLIGGIRNEIIPFGRNHFLKLAHTYYQDYTVFNSLSARSEFLKSGYLIEKSIFIPNCYLNVNSAIVREENKNVEILSVGRLVAQKDYLTAIKAIDLVMASSKKMSRKIHYTIIGYGKLASEIQQYIKICGLSDEISLITDGDIIDLDKYYRESDIFVNCSIFEGTSNSILEAMSYSLPIVATDVGDTSKLVSDKVNGYLVPPSDYKLLANRLSILIESCDKRNIYGCNSFVRIEDYGIGRFQSRYVELIDMLK